MLLFDGSGGTRADLESRITAVTPGPVDRM